MQSLTKTIAVIALLIACSCGGGYVSTGYVQPVYEPGLTVVHHGGNQGYWVGGTFHPMVVVGGASGYYRGNTFVSNHISIQTAARERRYIPAASPTAPNNRPNYSSSPGTSATSNRSTPTYQSTGSTPRYSGASQRPVTSTYSRPAPAPSRPSYSTSSRSTSSSSTTSRRR